jgi:hypothetical protein
MVNGHILSAQFCHFSTGNLSSSSITIIIFASLSFTHRFLSKQQLCLTIFVVCGMTLLIFSKMLQFGRFMQVVTLFNPPIQ